MNGQHHSENQIEEDLGQLAVSETQRPQSQVGSSVGDSSEHKLNGFDSLMNEGLAELDLLVDRFDVSLTFLVGGVAVSLGHL
jgi:hypothetical protein